MAHETVARLVGVVWLSAVVSGFWVWEQYDATPGAVKPIATASDAPAPERWRLTVFVHPRCPCTRATLDETARIVEAVPELAVRVLFVRPPGAREGWERGQNWERAARVPGAEVACDDLGTEARRLGAETSGQVVLTNPNGEIVFRGGLTAARGRTGAGTGREAVIDWVRGRTGAPATPVFGCPLFTPEVALLGPRVGRGNTDRHASVN